MIACLDVRVRSGVQDASDGLLRCRRHRDDDLLDAESCARCGQLGGGAEYGDTVDRAPLDGTLVIEESDDLEFEVGSVLNLAQEKRACASGSHDEDLASSAGSDGAQVQKHAGRHSCGRRAQEDQDGLDEQNADGNGSHALG